MLSGQLAADVQLLVQQYSEHLHHQNHFVKGVYKIQAELFVIEPY